jgi:hypothetical protein
MSYYPEGYAGASFLLVGSPMPDKSEVMTQTKRDALALQVGDGNGKELSSDIVLPQGVATLPMRATGHPGPGSSACYGSRPQGEEGVRRESSAAVKAIHLGEITPEKSWSSRLGVCREASSLTQENYLLKISTKERRTDDFRTTKAS